MLDRPTPPRLEGSARDADGLIKLAIMAVGGQGGGVLSDWIVAVAERSGYVAQSTSVAGVAQRTGATIYYVEMAPDTGRLPVFALSPAQGDVDILIAAEMMEAGRAIMRGFVTPERTTLIASSHRIAAVSEKIEPGDGRASSEKVAETAELAAKRLIAFDMEKIAVEAGSMISASLLGALAGSDALPFPREVYEAVIGSGGRGAKQSIAAFGGGYRGAQRGERPGEGGSARLMPDERDRASEHSPVSGEEDFDNPDASTLAHLAPFSEEDEIDYRNAALLLNPLPGPSPRKDREKGAASAISPIVNGVERAETFATSLLSPFSRGEDGGSQVRGSATVAEKPAAGPQALLVGWRSLLARIDTYAEPTRDMAGRGLRKVVDYQDLAYGAQYLDMLDETLALDSPEQAHALTLAAAKHIANALCYDDMIRVADLKTRSTRDARVRREVGVKPGSVVQVTEYFHPRVEEFCGTMPAGLGRAIESRPKLAAWIDRRINRGRRIRTDSAFGFSMLWVIGGLRRFRRKLLRHEVEMAHIERWYRLALYHVPRDYALAVEILNCRRLIKGYSDTHMRAQSKFDRVLSGLPLVEGRADAADWIRRLREMALKDEKGDLLDGALKTIESLASTP